MSELTHHEMSVRGGLARAKKLSKSERRRIASMGGLAKGKNKKDLSTELLDGKNEKV
jgi:hypothetical protein